jgi:hypothetical protein
VIADQEQIGWHMAMQGYLSKHWRLAVSVNWHLEENNDKGDVWVHKTVMLLWDFAHEMWEYWNSVLHDTKLEASRAMHDAEINDAITKLYEKVDTYSTEDQWYFDVPLAIRLRKPLRSRQCWLVNARILDQTDDIEPVLYSSPVHKESSKCVSWKDWISSRVCPDESIESIWCPYAGSRLKIPSHLLWLGMSILHLHWCRQPSYYSCQKM